MYKRRRLVAALLALLVIGGIVALIVWQPWRAWAADAATGSQATPTASATSSVVDDATPAPTSPAPSDSAAASPSPTPTETAEAEDEDAQNAEPCTTGDVTVAAVADKGSYGTGELPNLSIRLTNDTEMPCVINVGTAAQTFEITSGSDTWWRSTDCQKEPSDQVVTLGARQTVASAAPIVWDRTRSSVDSCDGDRQKALPGWYNLTVSIGGIESVEPAQFTLR